nr:bradykinin potentiating peptide D [Gloydius blomhoffii]
EGLPPRPIPP